jgi:vacuolar iron transporter family protein
MHDSVIKGSAGKEMLHAVHQPEAIAKRLARQQRHSYLKDVVFGSVDGTVTTFAIVAGVAGAAADIRIALVLGLANLAADGFSMAAGNYLSTKTVRDELKRARRIEEYHIDVVPEGEREEVRQIYRAKGFSGSVLNEIVRVLTRNKERWVDTMVVEEHGLCLATPSPWIAALATIVSFCVAGLLPLLPLIFAGGSLTTDLFLYSAAFTGVGFVIIGIMKSLVLKTSTLWSLLETLTLGGLAALLAFFVGFLFR